MFTIDQIRAAHAKVKSGADFPRYIQELKTLGVISYNNYVADGRTDYYGDNDFKISSPGKYAAIPVADIPSFEKLQYALIIHQKGQTDYLTFCKQAADAGVEKWKVDAVEMTCTYYDKAGQATLKEEIPG